MPESSTLSQKVSRKDERDQKKEKVSRTVKTGKTSSAKVLSHSQREELRQKREEEQRLDKIRKLKKSGASLQIIDQQVKSHVVKSAIRSVGDKRVHDPKIQKLVKDELKKVAKNNVSKKKGKYDVKPTSEFSLFDPDDGQEIDLSGDFLNLSLVPSEVKSEDDKKGMNPMHDLITSKEEAILAKQARDAIKTIIKTELEPVKQAKALDIKKQRDKKFSQTSEVFTNFEVSTVKDDFKNLRAKKIIEKPKSGYSKEDARALREFNNRKKQQKKDRKKERQAERKAIKPSFISESGDKFPDDKKDEGKSDKKSFPYEYEEKIADAKWRAVMNDLTEHSASRIIRLSKTIDNIIGIDPASVGAFFAFIDMMQADTYFSFLRANYQFANQLLGDDLPASFMLATAAVNSAVVVTWKKAINVAKDILIAESGKKHAFTEFADLLDSGITPISMIISGEFAQSLRSLIIRVTAMRLFSKDTAMQIYECVGRGNTKDSNIVDLFTGVVSDISKLSRMAGRIAEGESVRSVLSGKGGLDYNLDALRELDASKNLLYSGLPVEGRMYEVEWLTKVNEVVPFVQKYKGMYGPLTIERQRIETLLASVLMRRDEIQTRTSSQHRITPLCFVATGIPNIGKSKIIDFVFSQHCLALGRPYDPRYVYHKNKGSKFWDAFDAPTQPYLHLSEVGNLQPNVAATMGDPSVLELLSVIDSQPYCVDQAKLEDKGKSWIKFEGVVIDTNTVDMNLKVLFKNSAAYFRRLVQIDVRVKPQYAKYSGAIDTSKLDDDSMFFDKWHFDVTEFEALNNVDVDAIPKVRNGDIHDLAKYIQEKTIAHTKRETATVQRMADPELYEGYGHRRREVPQNQQDIEMKMQAEAGVSLPFSLSFCEKWSEYSTGNVSILGKICHTLLIASMLRMCDYSVDLPGSIAMGLTMSSLFIMFHIWLSSYLHMFVSVAVIAIFGKDIMTFVTKRMLTRTRAYYTEMLYIHWNSFLVFNGLTKDVHENWMLRGRQLKNALKMKHILVASATGGSLYLLWKFLSSRKNNPLTAESFTEFVLPSDYNEKINEIEKRVDAGESYRRVPSKVVADWDNVIKVEIRNKHVNGIDELERTVSNNVRSIRVMNAETRTYHNTMGIGLKSNILMCNTHALPKTGCFEIQVSRHGYLAQSSDMVSTFVTKEIRKDLKDDITLIWVTGDNFRDITSHLFEGSSYPQTVHARIGGQPSVAAYRTDFIVGHEDGTIQLKDSYQFQYAEHFRGMCGMPLFGRVKDKSFILGMHVAGSVKSADCLAIALDKDYIIAQLDSPPHSLMPILSLTSVVDRVMEQIEDEVFTTESGFDLPNSKSPINYLKLKNMVCYGKLPGEVCVMQKSMLAKTPFNNPELPNLFFEEFGHVQQTVFGKPMMKPGERDGVFVSPYNIFLDKFSQDKVSLDKGILQKCVDEFTEHIISGLEAKGHILKDVKPLTVTSALNGVSYDCYSRRVTMSKAAGFGFPGKKKKHVEEISEHIYEPSAKLKREFFKIAKCYKKGQMSGFVYNATLKDEPRPMEKVKAGKTRVFFASSFPSLLISKAFMGPIYSLMVESSECFCTAIGTDMHREADDLLKRFRWLNNLMAGDYGSYDQKIPFDISWASCTVVYNLAKKCSYNEEALKIVQGILSDGLFSLICILKDLYMMAGLQPSGKLATAEDNSIKGVLLLMYAWYSLEETRDFSFFEHNDPCTYGDDLGNSVDPNFAEYFNDIVYSAFCKKNYNMEYTASNKGDVYRPFTPLNEYTFLKRSFTYSEELGRMIAPLDLDSILKTLSWRLVSDSISEADQIFAMLQSTCYELWFHCDRDKYKRIVEWLFSRYVGHFGDVVSDYIDRLPSYEKLKASFMSHLMDFSEEENPWESDMNCCSQTFECNDITPYRFSKRDSGIRSMSISELMDYDFSLADTQDLYLLRDRFLAEIAALQDSKEDNIEQKLRDLRVTLQCIDTKIAKRQGFRTESGIVEMHTGEIAKSHESAIGTVEDIGGSEAKQFEGDVETFSILKQTDQEMGDFLSRPVEIFASQIPLGTNYDQVFDPWDLFTKEPSVRAKLKNFAYIKGDLVVRISVAGNPFNFGKLQVAYVPFAGENPILSEYIATPAYRRGKLQYLSQQKGVVNMDPKFNKPIEVVCPYFSPAPMMRLFNSSTAAQAAATSFDTIKDLGKIFLTTLNPMGSVSTGPATEISVYVYAYMTNVSLGSPTASILELTTESGEMQKMDGVVDERFSGPVSKWANAGTKFLDSFKAVPMLQPYVGPSSMVLSGVRDLAAHFGFSRPTLITPSNFVKNQPFQNSAHCIVADTSQKLTLDPKQETDLVISSGMTEDEMSYSYLCKREWYFHTFDWATTNAPNTTALFSFGVNPCTAIPYVTSTNTLYQPGPMFMVANMHSYWKGKITYRVEIVASAFHRGKLAVVFEPNVAQAGLIRTDLKLNKQYTAIIDIQETQDFEFCVDMAFLREWAMVLDKSLYNCVDGNMNTSDLLNYVNGFVRFHVVNRLQSPTADGVQVNIFARSDDMQFNRLSTNNLPAKILMRAESGEELDITCYELNQARMDDGKASCRYFGEEPRSLRLVFKRYVTLDSTQITFSAGNTSLKETYASYLVPNPSPTGLVTTIGTWQSYLMQAYVGYRGSLKYRWRLHGVSGGDYTWAVVTLAKPGNAVPTLGFTQNTTPAHLTFDGSVTFSPCVNTGVEFDVPFYSNNLFVFSNASTPWPLLEHINQFGTKAFSATASVVPSASSRTIWRQIDYSLGDDFTFLYFTGSPPYSF